jgi:hypothetical protein
MTTPLDLETVNEFLELQEGRCITCRQLFAHCGGRVDLAIPCRCCFAQQEGLECVECSETRRRREVGHA